MAIGCRIKKSFTRPAPALVEAFRGIPAANIDDCMNRMGSLSAPLEPMNKSPLLGVAFTVKCPAGDSVVVIKPEEAEQLAKGGRLGILT